jgi:hypothetical protein
MVSETRKINEENNTFERNFDNDAPKVFLYVDAVDYLTDQPNNQPNNQRGNPDNNSLS